ncbi:hypothetical protein Nepgr_011431 [Nepenthes gracilis]|uniref:Uncharacterized protein n=1 Tax=Nepenthes gracilis TaxID=150966 RepID=A0AAD3SE19_NEPGR|nr:hypothetical protein Nepgr_011431 [Nepenthes gracilis]
MWDPGTIANVSSLAPRLSNCIGKRRAAASSNHFTRGRDKTRRLVSSEDCSSARDANELEDERKGVDDHTTPLTFDEATGIEESDIDNIRPSRHKGQFRLRLAHPIFMSIEFVDKAVGRLPLVINFDIHRVFLTRHRINASDERDGIKKGTRPSNLHTHNQGITWADQQEEENPSSCLYQRGLRE